MATLRATGHIIHEPACRYAVSNDRDKAEEDDDGDVAESVV